MLNVNSLIILYASTQKSRKIMLNFQEKLIERNSTICQFYTCSISTSKSKNSTILEKIRANKFTKYIFLVYIRDFEKLKSYENCHLTWSRWI